MLDSKYITSKSRTFLLKKNIYIITFLLLSNLIPIHIALEEYDHIITFDHSKFKAGNFAKNKNGELFIEYYSEDDNDMSTSRLFYGRQKNGRELFFNESSNTQEINIGLDEIIDISGYYNYFDIYDSKIYSYL